MSTSENSYLLYQPDESPSHPASLLIGFQSIMGRMTGLAASTAIIVQASGQPASYLSWVFFVSLAVCGVGTMCQTFQVGRFGSGYPIGVGNGTAYIAVCISALVVGGPAMLSSLIIVSALVQFVLVSRLSLLRRIITPTVNGTILMLLAATVISVLFSKLATTSGDAPPVAAPATAGATFAVMIALRLVGPPAWQPWGPLVGILTGCAVAAPFGLLDIRPFLDAGWLGIPFGAYPGFGFTMNLEFWALLPGFIIVNLAVTIYGISDLVAVQQASWRRPRATDFRVVQGAFNIVALTSLATALLGALPNSVSPGGSSRVLLTGVASRRTGRYAGALLVAMGFLPKVIAILTAVPAAVFGAYSIVRLALMFVQGIRLVVQGGVDARKAVVVGAAFWLGVGFQNQLIFPELLGETWGVLLSNGLTTGSIALILFTLVLEATSPRRRRLRVALGNSAFPRVDEFLSEFAQRAAWDKASENRLRSAGEETLASLLPQGDAQPGNGRRLVVSARRAGCKVELEFVTTSDDENLEDRLAYLSDQPEVADERELSFRLLRHYASSVSHRKYHGLDVVTVEVEEAH